MIKAQYCIALLSLFLIACSCRELVQTVEIDHPVDIGEVLVDLEEYIQANGGAFKNVEGPPGGDDVISVSRGPYAATILWNAEENIEGGWDINLDQVYTNSFFTTIVANTVVTRLQADPDGALDAIGYNAKN